MFFLEVTYANACLPLLLYVTQNESKIRKKNKRPEEKNERNATHLKSANNYFEFFYYSSDLKIKKIKIIYLFFYFYLRFSAN